MTDYEDFLRDDYEGFLAGLTDYELMKLCLNRLAVLFGWDADEDGMLGRSRADEVSRRDLWGTQPYFDCFVRLLTMMLTRSQVAEISRRDLWGTQPYFDWFIRFLTTHNTLILLGGLEAELRKFNRPEQADGIARFRVQFEMLTDGLALELVDDCGEPTDLGRLAFGEG